MNLVVPFLKMKKMDKDEDDGSHTAGSISYMTGGIRTGGITLGSFLSGDN